MKARDQVTARKKAIKEQLDAYLVARKRDRNGIYNKLERAANDHKMDRGKAFGGKYDGTVAKEIMQDPTGVYNKWRRILKEERRPGVEDAEIDGLLMNQVIELMTAWNDFFTLLRQTKPTDADRKAAPGGARKAVDLHVALLGNKTPKVHTVEDHAVEQFLCLRPGLMALIMEDEDFVERNHQTGSKIEDQHKRVANLQDNADYTAAKMYLMMNPEVQRRIKEVNDATKRGSYKERKREAAPPSEAAPSEGAAAEAGSAETANPNVGDSPT